MAMDCSSQACWVASLIPAGQSLPSLRLTPLLMGQGLARGEERGHLDFRELQSIAIFYIGWMRLMNL